MRRIKAVAVVLGALFGSAGAFAADAPAPAAPKVTYQDHVLPILRNACLNCHNPDKKKGDLNLSSHAGAMTGGATKIIEPGDPDGSKLMKLITHAEEPAMPPKGDKLNDKDIAIIRAWIAAGAPETTGSKVVINKPKTNLAVVTSVGKPDGPVAMPPANLPTEPVVTVKRPSAIASVASSPWAPIFAIGGQKQISLYHSETLELIGVLAFPEGIPNTLKFSRNGQLLLAGGGIGAKSGKVIAWNITTGQRAVEVGDEFDAVLAADMSPDQSLVALGTPLRMLKIYATADGQVQHSVKKHTDWVTAVAYSPDGKLLASGDRAGGLWVWEGTTARELFNCAGHKEGVTDACFRGDSKIMASASQDGTFKLWNMDDGKMAKSIAAHAGGVLSISFTHDGKIVTSGRDGLVKVWTADGSLLKAMEPFGDIALKSAFTHDGNRVIGGDYTGAVRVFNVADGKRIADLSANPPTGAQRLAMLDGRMKELQPAIDKANIDLKNAQDAANNAAAALKQATDAKAAAEKAIETTGATLATAKAEKDKQPEYQQKAQAMKEARSKATASHDAIASEIKSLTNKLATGQQALESAGRGVEKAKAAAVKKPDDKTLADAVTKAQSKFDKAQTDVEEWKKAHTTATGKLKAAKDEVAKSATDFEAASKKAADSQQAYPAAKAAADKAKITLDQSIKALAAQTTANKTALDQLAKVQNDAKVAQQTLDAVKAQRAKLAAK